VPTHSSPALARFAAALGLLSMLAAASVFTIAQRGGMFQGSADDPGIKYRSAPVNNVVARLNDRLQAGTTPLAFEGRSGYLRAALAALEIPVDSQMLVFSPTSLQAARISPANPRALFFSDQVALGWVRDGDVLEVAAHDATQGIVFYTLEQRPAERPQFKRETACLGCHSGGPTLGVPGLLMFSTRAADANSFARSVPMDHRSPLKDRFGGWFVTGRSGAAHAGNLVPPSGQSQPPQPRSALDEQQRRQLASVDGLFDHDGYQSKASDIAALLVFAHHTHMINVLTRASWEARAADPALHPPYVADAAQQQRIAEMLRGIANEVVDYLLFVDEAPLPDPVTGASGFAERFSAAGPHDAAGRSLHQLDLTHRLMKYPCSYLIYSPAFDALPPAIKEPIYQRMWQVLSGRERDPRYQSALPRAARQTVIEILRTTKQDLPAYFQSVIE
jgi:hypothetical protein